MNYNDIDTRLKCIYTSIKKQSMYGAEALSSTKVEISSNPSTGSGKIVFSFGDGSDSEIQNQIKNVISNLANLKDCVKNRMTEQNKDSKLIESDINESSSLKLVLDLSNQEKHGYPLKRVRRSKKDPIISNIQSYLSPSNKPDNFTYQGTGGSLAHNTMISIRADIIDAQGERLCTFDKLINQAIEDWEQIIRKHQII